MGNFDDSDLVIACNFHIGNQSFTHISSSFEQILGYQKKKILSTNFLTKKMVHPQDLPRWNKCLEQITYIKTDSLNPESFPAISRIKCRAKHVRGYWKYFVVYFMDYLNKTAREIDKIGLMVDERINKISEEKLKHDKKELVQNFWKNQSSNYRDQYLISQEVTPRETEILQLLGNGLITKEIASRLHISECTVITHRKNLINKLKARNTAELIKMATQYMIIF